MCARTSRFSCHLAAADNALLRYYVAKTSGWQNMRDVRCRVEQDLRTPPADPTYGPRPQARPAGPVCGPGLRAPPAGNN